MAVNAEDSLFLWKGLSTFPTGSSAYERGQLLLDTVHWDTLCKYASSLRNGQECSVENPIGMGGRHLVRILTFEDGVRWIARLRIPRKNHEEEAALPESDRESDLLVEREVDCLTIVAERTSTPVPKVYGRIAPARSRIGATGILMECLWGNAALDICFDSIPRPFKPKFFYQMARAQTQISTIQFPKIGSVIRQPDGQYDIGPLPILGGPFDTASEYIRAWAATARFPHSMEWIKDNCGDFGDEIARSTGEFLGKLNKLADKICSSRNTGPFPLVHVDYGHNNIIVTPEYDILGVIDWEHAFVAPWQAVEYPLTVSTVPRPMDAPWNYDPNGTPVDEYTRTRHQERLEYLACVKAAEEALEVPATLSSVLADEKGQDVATAMRLFAVDGKMGKYSGVLDAYE